MPRIHAPTPGSCREIIHLAWPIWVSMISVTLKGVVDMLMVGRLGTSALAGVGLGGVLAFNGLCFGMGILRGQKSLVSQYLGAGERSTAFRFGVQAFYLACAFALICVGAGMSSEALFGKLSAHTSLDAEALEAASEYFGVRLYWSGTMLLSLAVAEYLRGTGRTRLPMAADLISQPLNMLFNYALIFGRWGVPALGVSGAAVGTGLSDLFSLVLLLTLARPRGRRFPGLRAFRLEPARLWRVFAVGTASGIQFTLEVGSYTLVTLFVGVLGTASMAAHQAAMSILHFAFMSAVAIADGGAVLIGRYVGALDWAAARRTLRGMLSLNVPLMVGVGLLFFAFGEPLMSLFMHDPDPAARAEAIRLGAGVLGVAAIWQLGDSFQISLRFALRAAGDHRWVMWVGITCSWLLSAPLAWAAVYVFHGGVSLVWLLWSAEIYVGAVIFLARWRNGVWQRKRLVRGEPTPEPRTSPGLRS